MTSASRNGRPATSGWMSPRSAPRLTTPVLGAVARDEPGRDLAPDGRDGRDRGELRRDPVEGVAIGGADEPAVRRQARTRAGRIVPERGIHHITGHDPVGRVLAATDADDAIGLGRDAMLARGLDRGAARRRDKRTETGIRPHDVRPLQVTSIVALTVSRSLSTSQPSAVGRSGAPSTAHPSSRRARSPATARGRRSCRARGSSARRCAGMRDRGTTRWAPRLGRMRIAPPPNGWTGRPPTPRRVDDGVRPDVAGPRPSADHVPGAR